MHNYAEGKPENFQACWSTTLDLCDTGAAISAIELATQLGDGH